MIAFLDRVEGGLKLFVIDLEYSEIQFAQETKKVKKLKMRE